ncbi:MAG TPA: tRNA lysidine(34) synthetase TilS, partial [Dinghuibacter sp.]|uniref:tRNA lysidine(34) synthetase TilS n=1 Tax=Dinghuibacter sp. TaxID=2024697 RepID=UPI002C93091C
LDDNIETLLMNLVKGTGATGLRAMLPKQNGIVRPLLFATREEIVAYAKTEGLLHVEDSSNANDKYTRNFFRHRVIPLIEERYPEARQNLAANLARFREVETLYREAVNRHLEDLLEQQGPGHWRVPVAKLERVDPLDTIFYELLNPFGFSPAQAGEAQALIHSTTGHSVASATHRVIRDRKFLLIVPVAPSNATHITIEEGATAADFPDGRLTLTLAPPDAPLPDIRGTTAPKGSAPRAAPEPVAHLDASKVQYPLLLRRWKPGDYFYPLGMPKKKKLARFLIDNKVSVADKEKVWILESAGRILWVVGRRIDDRVKVTPATREILKISVQNGDASTDR